jgi:hypothetical protein
MQYAKLQAKLDFWHEVRIIVRNGMYIAQLQCNGMLEAEGHGATLDEALRELERNL